MTTIEQAEGSHDANRPILIAEGFLLKTIKK